MCCYVSSIELVKVVLDNVRLRIPKHIPKFLTQIGESQFVDCDQQQAALFRKQFGPLVDDDESSLQQVPMMCYSQQRLF